MLKSSILCVIFLIYNQMVPSVQYNLDLETYKQHFGNTGSMFGFSIALHKYFNKNWVIVGAPKTHHSFNLTNVERPGAVYRCDLQETNRCILIPFDSKGNQFNDRNEQVDTKSNQWLGATLASGGENGPIVACAPRYVFHTMQPSKVARVEPVGTCFTAAKNFTVFTEYSPCRTNFWGYHRQGSCQAGFSATISKSGDRLFVGAPGSWYWQGQVYSIHPDATFPYKPPPYQDFGIGGQTYSYDVMDRRTIVYSTRESYSTDDDSYLGYSMISGDFNNDGEEDVAVGMPRGSGLLGKVVIYRWNMTNQLNITGQQIGAYFGYSVCTSDVDGDKRDDLIIGAPMFAEQNNEGKYDVGRVYVMLQGNLGKFEKRFIRDGFHAKSRFGTAVTNLGDINQDGFGDFAVGAPYDGVFGRGAVYVYHGSKEGPLEKYSQVIHAEDVAGTNYPRTFGFSLAGGLDMDGNLYPDLAVGAYDSDTVFVFRSRPVAIVDASTQFSSANKLINLEKKTCTLKRNGKQVPCAEIESCLAYDGVNVPSILDFDVQWLLDSKKIKNPRMFFIENEGKNLRNATINLEYGKIKCFKQTVYVIENLRDKLTPLEVEMRYQLSSMKNQPHYRFKRSELMPVIDQNRDIVQRDSLNIQKNCGPDNICIPDLYLDIKTVDKFLLGSKVPLEVEVLIANNGEDAFESAFFMTIPSDLNFKKIQQVGASKENPITCSAPSHLTNYTLKCDVGNPFMAGKVANFKIIMMPAQKARMAPSYDFYMEVNSTNPEKEGSEFNNVIKKRINVWIKTDIVVEGLSRPDIEHYKASNYKALENATSENELGPHVVHIYNVRNNGPSAIEEAILYVHWPYQTLGGKTLMYIMNRPEISGNIVCEPNSFINVNNLDYDISLSSKSYLESTGAVVKLNSNNNEINIQLSHGSNTNHFDQQFHDSIATNRTKILTEEERRRLAEEDNAESTGDASLIHSERAKETLHRNDDIGSSGQWTSSWSSTNSSDGQPIHFTKFINKTITYDSQGNPYVTEHKSDMHKTFDESLPQYRSSYSNNYNYITPSSYAFSSQNNLDFPGSINVMDKNDLSISNPSIQGHVLNQKAEMGYHGFEQTNLPHQYQNSASYVNKQPSGQIQMNLHRKRSYQSKREISQDNYENIEPCRTAKCQTFRCVVSNLGNNEEAWIAIRARLVAKTLESLAENVPINVSTLAIAQVTKLPYIGKPSENVIKSHEIFFKAIPEPIPPIDTVPLWVVVLSACAGTIILLLLVFLLYKCGFFKRNRPTNNLQERQPLNSKNGYHGDEHL